MTSLPAGHPGPVRPAALTAAPRIDGGLRGLTTDDLQRIATAIDAEVAASTRTTYASAWRSWETWCRRRGLLPLPADPDALAAYLTERAETGLCNGTLDGDCAAIAHRHRQEGFGDPTAVAVVRRVRRGLRRILGTAPRRQAHPLTVAELAQIVASIAESRIGIRDRAVLLLGYAAALRPSEIAALHLADISVGHHGLLVTIRRSKTDQERQGQMVGVAAGLHAATDPIRAIRVWLALRPAGPGPLFTRVPATRPITSEGIGPRTVSDLVRNRAAAGGLGDLGVTGHSLRAGHATTAAVNGAPLDRIAAQTRHRDLTTLFNHYIRPADALAHTTSRDLGL
jgi:integrase